MDIIFKSKTVLQALSIGVSYFINSLAMSVFSLCFKRAMELMCLHIFQERGTLLQSL